MIILIGSTEQNRQAVVIGACILSADEFVLYPKIKSAHSNK